MPVCKVYRGMQQLAPGTNKTECLVRYTKTAPKNKKLYLSINLKLQERIMIFDNSEIFVENPKWEKSYYYVI